MNSVWDIQRRIDGQTDKGYYYGPHQVNLGSKIIFSKNLITHNFCIFTFTFAKKIYKGSEWNYTWSFSKVIHI